MFKQQLKSRSAEMHALVGGSGDEDGSTATAPSSLPSSPSAARATRTTTLTTLQLLQQQRRQQRASIPPASIVPPHLTRVTAAASAATTTTTATATATSNNRMGAKSAKKNRAAAKDLATLPAAADEASVMRSDAGEEEDGAESLLVDADGEGDGDGGDTPENVVVCVRVRGSQSDEGSKIWQLDGQKNRIVPTDEHPTLKKRNTAASSSSAEDGAYDFRFDSLVLPDESAEAMYDTRIAPIVDAVIQGYNGTVFAYGQTGSGKTYTMSGGGAEKGVIPQAIGQIFAGVEAESSREFLLRVSYLEIYNENLHDLLAALTPVDAATDAPDGRPSSPTKGGSSHVVSNGSAAAASASLRIFEAGGGGGRVQIQGLREEIVTTADGVLDLLQRGQQLRHQAATDWNERSSRSHCVFMLTVESRENGGEGAAGGEVRLSQLNLIDLAGSERAASEKERRKEGAYINKSLLTLGTVIAKLSEQQQQHADAAAAARHIPYRDSKLTRLLQASLGGNARVAVVCTLSGGKEHAAESLSTLRFGQRCKMVVTRAKQGSVVDDKALIARYRRELDKLRTQLLDSGGAVPATQDDAAVKALHDEKERAAQDVRDMNAKRDELKKQIEHLTKLILTGKNVEAGAGAGAAAAEEESEADKTRRIRASRRSDLGTSSPSKRCARAILTPIVNTSSTTKLPSGKPFAMESELAVLRANLSKALAAKQASEEARRQEVRLWQVKVTELEEANKEQEEELDEAEAAFEKLKAERNAMRAEAHQEKEANRLLKLVAQSRTADVTSEQRRALEEAEARVRASTAREEKGEREREALRGEVAVLRKQVQEAAVATVGAVPADVMSEQRRALEEAEAKVQASTAREETVRHEREALRGEVETLKKRLQEAAAVAIEQAPPQRSIPSPPLSSSSSSSSPTSSPQLVELQIENDIQKARIASLERQLAVPARTSTELERQLQSERDEVARLNNVIATQRNIMADLEAGVTTWKRRLRTQQEIIAKLVESGGGGGARSSPLLAASASVDVPLSPLKGAGTTELHRASSSASSTSSSSAPYYGAHIYNRPPTTPRGASSAPAQGLGLGSSSPTKGTAWLATMPGARPDPLPLPDHAAAAGLSSPTPRRRRPTIEHEIASLRHSPRVESTKSRLLEPAVSPRTQSPTRRPLPVPGALAHSQTAKDWYI